MPVPSPLQLLPYASAAAQKRKACALETLAFMFTTCMHPPTVNKTRDHIHCCYELTEQPFKKISCTAAHFRFPFFKDWDLFLPLFFLFFFSFLSYLHHRHKIYIFIFSFFFLCLLAVLFLNGSASGGTQGGNLCALILTFVSQRIFSFPSSLWRKLWVEDKYKQFLTFHVCWAPACIEH